MLDNFLVLQVFRSSFVIYAVYFQQALLITTLGIRY